MKAIILSICLFLLSACQVKTGSGSEIISGHVPATNDFSFNTLTNKSYKSGESIDFVLSFPKVVSVTGSPFLDLNIGGVPKVAAYVSGNGSTELLFRYTVGPGDTDTDGITVTPSINLNGGSLTFVLPTGVTPCNINLSVPSLASVKVDTTVPNIASVSSAVAGTYYALQNLNFTANFSENVFVTGIPRISIDVGGTTRYATYVSGSGSTALTFRYSVVSGDTDTNGILLTSPLDLNAGSIADAAGNLSTLTFTPPNTTAVLVSGDNPIILSVTPPSNREYLVNQNIEFLITFNEAVTVTGTPRISLNVGGATKYANYVSGSGTSVLTFRYTVIGGDLDSDGIVASSPIGLNGGTIRDGTLNNAILTFSPPTLYGVTVFTVNPFITSISIPPMPPTFGYDQSENVDFIVNFNEPMIESGGLSRLRLTVGPAIRYANYVSGSGTSSFTYRYTVPASDEDLDGIVLISPLQLNGSTIRNSGSSNAILTYTAPDTTSIKVDARAPSIVANTVPSAASYGLSQNLNFDVVFSEPVNITGSPRLVLTIGSTTRYATYYSGTGTSAITFRHTVLSGDSDIDGIVVNATIDLNSGSIKDNLDHNSAVLLPNTNTSTVYVDTIAPVITSLWSPPFNTYLNNDVMDFTVNTNESVYVTGSPRILLDIGGNARYATYRSGSGSNVLIFRYTVMSGDNDGDGIGSSSPIQPNGGTIRDLAGNNLVLTFTPPNTSGVLIDGVTANIMSITPPANGTYKTGAFLDFVVNYTNPVNVTGTPRISLTIGSSTVYANYVSGSGTSDITFRYTVLAGDEDTNGLALTSPLQLNGGSIKDMGNNNANLPFTAPNTTAVLVDGIDVVVSSITPPADGTYKIGDTLDFTVNFSYPAVVTGTPRISLIVGAATLYANYLTGSGSTTHTYRYTVILNDIDTDGIDINSPISLNGGTIRDSFGDNATLTFVGTNYGGKRVDGVRPVVSSVSVSPNGTYTMAQNIDFTLSFNENVNITGSPRLALTVGAASRYAVYQSGSGSSNIVFRYSVLAGDEDLDGISASTTIDLNAGNIQDIAGNSITNLSWTPPGLGSVNVDGIVPTIMSITPPSNATYGLSANLNWVVSFSEAVAITGSPVLTVNIGGATRNAVYLSGTGTTNITFRYTTVLNDSDTNGVDLTSPVLLSGGTIKDLAGNNANLNFSNSNYAGILVDAVPPSVSSVTLPINGSYQNGGVKPSMTFSVQFNEVVTVSGIPRIVMTIGSTTRYANYSGGSGSSTLLFNYTVSVNDLDLDGIAIANSNNIDLNGGTIRDAALNNASLGLGSLSTSGIFAVFPSMLHWWDLSDTNYITTGSGNITQLRDKINTVDLVNKNTVTYSATGFNGGSSGYMSCIIGNYMETGASINYVAVAGVFKSPVTSTGNLIWSNSASRPRIGFASTNLADLGTSGSQHSSGSFVTPSSNPILNFWNSNSGEYLFRAVKWDAPQPRDMRLCDMNGQVAEFFMFSSVPTNAQIDAIESYISVKHNGLMLP